MNTKRQVLGLAAVLAVTVLTGGAAVLGLVHRPVSTTPSAVVVQQAPPATPTWSEGGDR